MKIVKIPLAKIICLESAGVSYRVAQVPNSEDAPVLVKPIPNSSYYLLYEGHHRALKDKQTGKKEVTAVVGTPDYMDRNSRIMEMRLSRNPKTPIDDVSIVGSTEERVDAYYQDLDRFSRKVVVNTQKGTMLRIVLEIDFGDWVDYQFVTPAKGKVGGLILNPDSLSKLFKPGFLSTDNVSNCWGDDSYDPNVLPAAVCLNENGLECYATGFAMNVPFRYQNPYMSSDSDQARKNIVNKRGRITRIIPTVIYPNGHVWEGEIGDRKEGENAPYAYKMSSDLAAVIWSDHLVRILADENISREYFKESRWWLRPTSISLALSSDKKSLAGGNPTTQNCCTHACHTCGSTCSGGGCGNN